MSVSVIEALFWVSVTPLGGRDIIFGRWGWVGVYGALFWVGGCGWENILVGWVWVGIGAMFDNAGSKSSENGIIVFKD